MSISGRKHIRWLPPDRPHTGWLEPTSTLVLTSRKHNYFTDVRVLDSSLPPRTGLPDLYPSPPSPLPSRKQKTSYFSATFEWAFAGTSSSSCEKDAKGRAVRLARWSHWIDSKHKDGDDEVEDKGTVWDHGENLSLEKGSMVNPETGKVEPYEEVWRELPVEVIPSYPPSQPTTPGGVVGGSGSNNNKPGGFAVQVQAGASSSRNSSSGSQSRERPRRGRNKVSMVLRGENQALGIRGLIVRVGGWCQGVIKTGSETSVERWRWTTGEEEGESATPGWEQVVRIGLGSLPCRTLWEKEDLEVGQDILSGGLRWEVVEKEVWE